VFVSHRDGKTTATIKVNVGWDLLWAAVFFLIGLLLVSISARDGLAEHGWKLFIGLFLMLIGFCLGQATLRLIGRGQRAYNDAAGPRK
jgi:hypothetical protein